MIGRRSCPINITSPRARVREFRRGEVRTSVESPEHGMTAMVRVAALVGSSAAPELIQLSSPTPTDVPKRFQYLLGRVDKVELDKITLQLAAGGERVVSLPKGTLAPAKNTDVMAVLTDGGDKAIFLQPIDGIASSLATTMAADPP